MRREQAAAVTRIQVVISQSLTKIATRTVHVSLVIGYCHLLSEVLAVSDTDCFTVWTRIKIGGVAVTATKQIPLAGRAMVYAIS